MTIINVTLQVVCKIRLARTIQEGPEGFVAPWKRVRANTRTLEHDGLMTRSTLSPLTKRAVL